MNILYQNDNYIVREDGIESKPHNGHGGGYFIEKERLNTSQWFAHMSGKLWWDAPSFADAYYAAKRILLNETPNRLVAVEFKDLPTWYASLPDDHPEKSTISFAELADYVMSHQNVYPMVTVMLTREDAALATY